MYLSVCLCVCEYIYCMCEYLCVWCVCLCVCVCVCVCVYVCFMPTYRRRPYKLRQGQIKDKHNTRQQTQREKINRHNRLMERGGGRERARETKRDSARVQ